MAENALADPNPKVRAAAARALGPMAAVSSVPKLKAALNDKEPAVVLAAAHSLFLLGDREEVYDIDYQVLIGERKSADGFVKSQIDELKDPKVVAMMGFETGIGFVPFGGEAYEAFKRISKDDHTPVRVAAAKELAADRDPRIDAALARACSDKKQPVRAAAVFAIAKRDDPALLNVITPLLDDNNEIVRYDASAAVLRLSGGSSGDSE
jgi:HEAT repeat protein